MTAKPLPTIKPYGDYAVEIDHLTFGYPQSSGEPNEHKILNELELKLGTGSRCLLIGANGAGKKEGKNMMW